MDNLINKVAFTPVKGTDSQIKKTSPTEGCVYFATDSKKIYMSHSNELLTMGGNSSIYYGTRNFTDDEIYGDLTDFNFFGYVKDLDEKDLFPHADDLILNEPDGGFYRVIEAYPGVITGRRIAVSGTGGPGGGTGGGGSSTGKEELSLLVIGDRNLTILKKDSCILRYKLIAKDIEGADIFNKGEGVWKVNGKEVAKQNITPNVEDSFDITS